MSEGQIVWLMGLSGAGKTTLARALAGALSARGRSTVLLDGDELRQGLCLDLGFDAGDRRENLRRAAHVARLVAASGSVALAAFITPLEAYRRMIREIAAPHRITMIALDCPIETCAERDPKGLYEQAEKGAITGFTGLDAPYETPLSPDLRLDTRSLPLAECVHRIEAMIEFEV